MGFLQTRLVHKAFVVSLSDSGVFPELPVPSPDGLLSFPQFEWLYKNANLSGSLPKRCLEAGHGWRCLHLSVALPYVQTPVFIIQSIADSWQVKSPIFDDGLRALGDNIRE